jgi:O-methyltransferase involved in polyketide biosynthesis
MCVPRVLARHEGESIWEGNTMHLTAPAVSRVLIDITRHVKRFSISFDYIAEEVIAKTTWRSGNNKCCREVRRYGCSLALRHQ